MTPTARKEHRPTPRLHRRKHAATDKQFYDEGLGHMQGHEHAIVVYELANYFRVIARRLGLLFLCDHAVWYQNPQTGGHRIRSPDLLLARENTEPTCISTRDILFTMEVVSTNTRALEVKDTIAMKALNAKHGVQEYVLYYPQQDDSRCLFWYRLDEKGEYREVRPDVDGFYCSSVISKLQLRERPPEQWEPGRKIDIYFNGELFIDYNNLDLKYRRLETEVSQLKTKISQLEIEVRRLKAELGRRDQ